VGFFGTRSTSTSNSSNKSSFTAADDRRQNYQATSKTKISKKAKAKVQTDRDNDSSDKLSNYKVKKVPAIIPGSTILNAGIKVRQKTFEVNRDYFRKNVVGKNNYKDTFESYESYIKGRSTGKLDAMGRVINTGVARGGGNDNNTQGIQLAKAATGTATVKGPKEIQKDAANTTVTKMSAGQINIANKRKGRIKTNITAKKTLDKNYTLSQKTLLG